ncbi:tetratricopeptide repeat-containing glycosyltransferase family 2 protein [Fervidobacterium thailandense]|uniref:Glycosyl transferase n=1 Tax=Fervidobacterium thailandense TaxID=1008305 RepID=A0A1E3G308_9BACT|nr:glycosyltransferase [Fervidobacterium thailandense]ODN30599.1 glycosyl transferase [Fervidobacterium thailandense]
MSQERCLLSVAMIMRDEAHNLDRALGSIRPYVDEIIVVDTGSKDNSVEIARKYTDKIYYYEWHDDFSAARNFSLQFPTCEWVLIYDADEEVREDFAGIREFLKSLPKDVNTVYLPTISYLDWDLKKVEVASTARVFRNGTVRYEHIVHNQPVYKGKVVEAKFPIYHYGYIWTRSLKKKKYARSSTLIRKTLEEKDLSPHEEIYYTAQLYKIESIGGKVHEKYQLAERTIRLLKEYKALTPIALEVMFLHGMDLYAKGLHDSAEELFRWTISFVSENPDPYCGLAILYDAKKDYEKVIEAAEKFFENKALVERFPEKFVWTIMSLKFSASVRMVLSLAYLRLGNILKFREHFPKIFEEAELTAEDPKKIGSYILASFLQLSDEQLREIEPEFYETVRFCRLHGVKIPLLQVVDKLQHAGLTVRDELFENAELSNFEKLVFEKLKGTNKDLLMDWLFGIDRVSKISELGVGALLTYFQFSSDDLTEKLKVLNAIRKSEDSTLAGVAYALIGDLYLKNGNFKPAIEYYRRAIEKLPEVSKFLKVVVDDLKSRITPEIDGTFEEIREFFFKNREFFADLSKIYPIEELQHAYLISDSDFAKYLSAVYSMDKDREKARKLLEEIKAREAFPFFYYRLGKIYELSNSQDDLKKAYEYHTKACITNYNLGDIALGQFPFDGFYVCEEFGNEDDEIVWVGNISENHSGLGLISPVRVWRKCETFYYVQPFPTIEVLQQYKRKLKNFRLSTLKPDYGNLMEVLLNYRLKDFQVLDFELDDYRHLIDSACRELGSYLSSESRNLLSFEALNIFPNIETFVRDFETVVMFYYVPDFSKKEDIVWRYPLFRVIRNSEQILKLFESLGFKEIKIESLSNNLRVIYARKS